jgi:hypothetical protein
MEKVTRSNETITTVVARPTCYQYPLTLAEWLELEECLRDAETGEFHQLIDRERACGHELLIERRCAFSGKCLALDVSNSFQQFLTRHTRSAILESEM